MTLHPTARRSAYTLIEVLVAMSILVVIMYAVIRIVSRVQVLTGESRAHTEIYESAKIFFDIIGQDLESIVVSNESGRPIYWTNDTGNMPTDMQMAWITASGIGTNASDTDPTSEVGYMLIGNDVYRVNTTISDGSDWDFISDTETWSQTPAIGSADSEVAANYVSTLSIRCFDSAGTELTNTTDSVAPAYIQVDISLYDRRAAVIGATETKKSIRKFSKNFWVARGE